MTKNPGQLTESQAQLYQRLTRQIRKSQHQTSRPYLFIGLNEKKKGLFFSHIHTDVFNLLKYAKWLPITKVPDNNAFVSFWTLDLLLEAFQNKPDYLHMLHLEDTVRSLMEFHDRTRETDDPLFLFWKQKKIGENWVSNAPNIAAAYPLFKSINKTKEKILKPFSKPDPTHELSGPSHPSHEPRRSSALFCLPADFDDSALNWTLGSTLLRHRSTFPEPWSTWSANNHNFSKLARHAVECSYRPFSNDKNVNVIDARTFYAIREFLWTIQDKGDGTSEFMLLTTWASSVDINRQGIKNHYKMPFNVNNVDFSVSANFVYAALKSVYADSFPDEVEEFPALIEGTVKFLVWGIESGSIVEKPDLLLLYYPSPYLAFFFVSRSVNLLQQPQPPAHGPAAELIKSVRELLLQTARKRITQYLLYSAKHNTEIAFWDTSLETDINSSLRRPKNHKDQKFVTALAINTLINLWTAPNDTHLTWLDQTPQEVKQLVEKAVYWLRQNAASKKYPDHNAFFSSSVKNLSSLPFRFPANMIEQVNGPVLCSNSSVKKGSQEGHSIFAMSGVPSREYYDQALEKRGLTSVNSDEFKRCYELDFPYWSAPSVVYALICLALAKSELLEL